MRVEIPLWIVATIGNRVRLARDFVGPCNTFAMGSHAVVVSIQAGDPQPFITARLDANDPTYEENLQFRDIEPLSPLGQSFSVDFESGTLAFSTGK